MAPLSFRRYYGHLESPFKVDHPRKINQMFKLLHSKLTEKVNHEIYI